MQVHLYGLLLAENGYPVDQVTLVGIPRDGNERDVLVRSEPWNRHIADEGLLWLRELHTRLSTPAPERPSSFCRDYCQFFDVLGLMGCPGKPS